MMKLLYESIIGLHYSTLWCDRCIIRFRRSDKRMKLQFSASWSAISPITMQAFETREDGITIKLFYTFIMEWYPIWQSDSYYSFICYITHNVWIYFWGIILIHFGLILIHFHAIVHLSCGWVFSFSICKLVFLLLIFVAKIGEFKTILLYSFYQWWLRADKNVWD